MNIFGNCTCNCMTCPYCGGVGVVPAYPYVPFRPWVQPWGWPRHPWVRPATPAPRCTPLVPGFQQSRGALRDRVHAA